MIRFYRLLWLALAASLVACGKPAPPPAAQVEQSVAPRDSLRHLVDAYWDETAGSSPWASWGGAETRYAEAPLDTLAPQALSDALAIERRYLSAVLLVPRAPLDAASKLTYDVFWRERELAIESFTYPSELLPVNAYDGVPQRFALMAIAAEKYALAGGKDLENWQSRAAVYGRWTDQAIANLREGMRRGYTLPLPVVERALPVLAALGEDSPQNQFYAVEADPQRARLALLLNGTVKERLLPAYRTLHDFLQREYLPRARTSVGLAALPLGSAWYAYLSKRATGTAAAPAQLHALGIAEVERVRERLQPLLAEAGFAGNAAGWLDSLRRDPRHSYRTAGELTAAYQALAVQLAAVAPASFPAPRTDFELHAVEAFRQSTAPALAYRRAMASGRYPARLYLNTAGLDTLPALDVAAQFLREAIPGHHYQIALQQERTDLPKFRRFGGSPAFIAGWGMYAASLGEELGVYHEPEARAGWLLLQLQCAAGMVIDSGLHAQKWTRTQALDYAHAQLPLDDAALANLVDRAIALPGEALACTAGYLGFQSLRMHAQQALGARFDLLAFHTEVLKHGALPLDLIEGAVKAWIETPVAAPQPVD